MKSDGSSPEVEGEEAKEVMAQGKGRSEAMGQTVSDPEEDTRPVRLVDQDDALSRRRHGFESHTGYHSPRWVRGVRLVGRCEAVVVVDVDRRWPGYWWARLTRRFVVIPGTLIAGGAIVRGPVHLARR